MCIRNLSEIYQAPPKIKVSSQSDVSGDVGSLRDAGGDQSDAGRARRPRQRRSHGPRRSLTGKMGFKS